MVTRTKKIFVGGLSAPTTLEDVNEVRIIFLPVATQPAFAQVCARYAIERFTHSQHTKGQEVALTYKHTDTHTHNPFWKVVIDSVSYKRTNARGSCSLSLALPLPDAPGVVRPVRSDVKFIRQSRIPTLHPWGQMQTGGPFCQSAPLICPPWSQFPSRALRFSAPRRLAVAQ